MFYKDIQAIKEKAIYKLFNHKLSTVIHMHKSWEISGTILTITSFLLNVLICWNFFLMGDFDVGMENNLNDNVFCKSASLPQLHLWKIPHSNSVIFSILVNAPPFHWKIFKINIAGCLISAGFWWYLLQVSKILTLFL